MRLFDADVRAASITLAAPPSRGMTQASNFSFANLAAASPFRATGSMPNWRKQSVRTVFAGSFRSTRAARAAAFLAGGIGAIALPRALSIVGLALSSKPIMAPGCLRAKYWKTTTEMAEGQVKEMPARPRIPLPRFASVQVWARLVNPCWKRISGDAGQRDTKDQSRCGKSADIRGRLLGPAPEQQCAVRSPETERIG